MMNKVIFLDSSKAEFEDAVRFYNSQSEGLGFEFALEVRNTLERIDMHPDAWHQLSINTRRCRTKRFPYGIVYQKRDEYILIVAIMHLHQKPRVFNASSN